MKPNSFGWQDILPVLISIVVIILVAVLEKQSKIVAALTATMPLTAALAIWIVYTSSKGDQKDMTQFSSGLLLGVIPTIGFLIVVWLAFRAGLKLLPALLLGYVFWGLGAAVILGLRNYLGQ